MLTHVQPIECCDECAVGVEATRQLRAAKPSCSNGNISANELLSERIVSMRHTWISSGARHETKMNLQWSDADFETHRREVTVRQASRQLQSESTTLVFCFGTWAGAVDTPVYTSLSHSRGGEARMFSSWFGAALSLGHNVLVPHHSFCKPAILLQLLSPRSKIIAMVHGMHNPPAFKYAGLCTVELGYMAGGAAIRIDDLDDPPLIASFSSGSGNATVLRVHTQPSSRPQALRKSGDRRAVEMTHIGYMSQCWSAVAQAAPRSRVLFWNKRASLESLPKCMQQATFWHTLRSIVNAYNEELPDEAPPLQVTVLEPKRKEALTKPSQLEALYQIVNASILPYLPHNELMGHLRSTIAMFGMGQSPDSPLPLDALSCGSAVLLPAKQHRALEQIAAANDGRIPFHATIGCDEMLSQLNRTLYSPWRSSEHGDRISEVLSEFQGSAIRFKLKLLVNALTRHECTLSGARSEYDALAGWYMS